MELGNEPKLDEETTGPSKISCPCGWFSEGPDQDLVNSSYTDHTGICPKRPEEVYEANKWYDTIFNFWTFLIVAVICGAVVSIATGHKL